MTQQIFLSFFQSSQVQLLITNNAFCIVQRATAQSKTGFFRDCGVAEAPPGFQAGLACLTVCIFLSLSVHFVCSSGFFFEVHGVEVHGAEVHGEPG
jgi:hypothetical protein